MTNNEKFQIKRRTARRNFWAGLCSTPDFSVKLLGVLLYLAGAVFVLGKQEAILAYGESIPLMSPVFLAAMQNAVPVYLFAGGIALAVLLVYPFGKRAAKDQLQSIGMINHVGMAPDLLHKRQDKKHPNVTIWEFRNQGLPLPLWETHQDAIEASLNIRIMEMTYGKDMSRVLLYAVPARTKLPEVLRWKDDCLSIENYELVLGESLLGPVTVNLAYTPHILLGGSTGSGKSVLLKLLLMQALRKSATVYIADFKGGVDFPKAWREKCKICFDEEGLYKILNSIVEELEGRKYMFNGMASNLDEFNILNNSCLERIIFACDEVAEILDKTGRSKEDKELLGKIESMLSKIARQGRAFGIHLILATQRPDANIIPGQIRSNMDFRVCGRADSILSQIILDNTGAADQIPKNARGRFILQDGTVFQAYWFDETNI